MPRKAKKAGMKAAQSNNLDAMRAVLQKYRAQGGKLTKEQAKEANERVEASAKIRRAAGG